MRHQHEGLQTRTKATCLYRVLCTICTCVCGRLERCNDVLERQVAVLRVSLERQKRSRSVAQIKVRNMERAKADADLRNETLQREMQLFFQMYGESRRRGGDEIGRGGRGSL